MDNGRIGKNWPTLLSFSGLLVLLLIFFFPTFTGGIFAGTGLIYSDFLPFNYPLKDLYRQFILEGRLPFWTNLMGNGYPLMAEGQIGALYPWHFFLFRLLPTLLAFNLNLFLHFIMAAGFCFIFCLVSLKLSPGAAFLGGMTYSLSGFFLTHLHQTNIILVIVYLPLLFFLTDRLVASGNSRWAFLMALIYGLQIFAGHIEMFYYTTLANFIFFLLGAFLFPRGSRRSTLSLLFLFLLAFALGTALAAAQLLPTWELTFFSQRAGGLTYEASAGPLWPLSALKLFILPRAVDIYFPSADFHPLNPDSINHNILYGYIGLLPLVLAVWAIFGGLGFLVNLREKRREAVIFLVLLLGALVFGMGGSTQAFSIFWEILPGLRFFREPVKVLFFIDFSLAVLAAIGFDNILQSSRLVWWPGGKPLLASAVILISFIDLYFNNLLLQPATAAENWLARPPAADFLEERLGKDYRFYTCGTGNLDYQLATEWEKQEGLGNLLPPDFHLLFRLPSGQEWVALFPKTLLELNQQGLYLDLERRALKMPDSLKKAWEWQNIKYVLCSLPIEDVDLFLAEKISLPAEVNHYFFLSPTIGGGKRTVGSHEVYIYENKRVRPRAFMVSSLERSAVFTGRAKIISDEETEVEVEVKAGEGGYLVLTDLFYPGWRAEIDGRAGEIIPVMGTFRAVAVGAGDHRVKFFYEPTGWRAGLAVSCLALVITLTSLAYVTAKRK